jgi:4'-phosphopantetheinyl transferase
MDEVELNGGYVPAVPGSQPLDPGAIHVWAIQLAGDADAYLPQLSAAELAKAERYRFIDHRRRYAIAHGALRVILAGYVGGDAKALEFRYGPRGKPYLDGGKVHFNLSHSSHLALLAVAGAELGVDLERLRHLESRRDIARRHFSASEFLGLEAVAPDEQLAAFYRVWTRKEAYIKAVGAGLSLSLDLFDVSVGEPAAFLAFRDGEHEARDWSLFDVSPAKDFAGALAIPGPSWRVSTFTWR